MWKIYKHIFPNGKVYIGQTKNSLSQRFQKGYGYITQPLIAKAIEKYGWDNVITEILEDNIPSQEEANQLEIKYIAEYDSRNPEKGYNIGIGGGIINKCDDERILSLWNEGKTQKEISSLLHYDKQTIRLYLDAHGISAEDRKIRGVQSMSKNSIIYDYEEIYQLWKDNKSYADIAAILNCSKDTVRSALERKNISKEERIERGITLSKKNRTNCKPVNQYDLNNNYIQTFKSITEANKALGKPAKDSNIGAVCKGDRKQAYGFKWAYAQ